jgi:hypothetical protein
MVGACVDVILFSIFINTLSINSIIVYRIFTTIGVVLVFRGGVVINFRRGSNGFLVVFFDYSGGILM